MFVFHQFYFSFGSATIEEYFDAMSTNFFFVVSGSGSGGSVINIEDELITVGNIIVDENDVTIDNVVGKIDGDVLYLPVEKIDKIIYYRTY